MIKAFSPYKWFDIYFKANLLETTQCVAPSGLNTLHTLFRWVCSSSPRKAHLGFPLTTLVSGTCLRTTTQKDRLVTSKQTNKQASKRKTIATNIPANRFCSRTTFPKSLVRLTETSLLRHAIATVIFSLERQVLWIPEEETQPTHSDRCCCNFPKLFQPELPECAFSISLRERGQNCKTGLNKGGLYIRLACITKRGRQLLWELMKSIIVRCCTNIYSRVGHRMEIQIETSIDTIIVRLLV